MNRSPSLLHLSRLVLRLSSSSVSSSSSSSSSCSFSSFSSSSSCSFSSSFSSFSSSSSCFPPVPLTRSHSSDIKVRSYLQYLKRKLQPPPSPPYSHVCQVGDPVLRCQAAPVDPDSITGPEVQKVISTLVKVMRSIECVGLSAPQIGVPLRILALEYTTKLLEEVSPESREARGVSVQPLRVFVNPKLRILDGRTLLFQEGCESIAGFSATVPRFLSVEVSGLDQTGQPVVWQTSGWTARILQHEMDHLDGVLYIDRMDSKTFINVDWNQHNQ